MYMDKAVIKLNNEAISDMNKIFGPNILTRSKTLHTYFICEDKILEVSYTHLHPTPITIKFHFIGDGFVVIFDENMKKLGTCFCYNIGNETAREQVTRMIKDAFGIQVNLE